MFFRKKKVTFDKVAKFNYELDTNEKLKEELKNLDVTTFTPIEALNKLYELANKAKEI